MQLDQSMHARVPELCKERIEIEPKTEFERDRGNSSMKSRPILPLISFNPTQRRPEKTKLIKQEREAPRWFPLSKISEELRIPMCQKC